jgi:PKD repeat protein
MKNLLQSVLTSFTLALVAVSAAGAQYTNFVTIAGSPGNPGYANGTNSGALFQWPYGVAQDIHSNLYVVDGYQNVIRKLTPDGANWVVTTIAGTPNPSAGDADGTNGAASFNNPVGIAVDTNGNLYVGENYGSTIRKITPVGTNWVVTTIAGQTGNFGWADGTNQAALFNGPENLTVDAQGNLFVADLYNSMIRKITPVGTNWVVTTIAGSPTKYGYANGTNGGASFDYPYGLTLDSAGNLYVSDDDLDFGGATIRKLTPMGTNWVVTTIAGTPTATGSADGTNNAALFNSPSGVASDAIGNLYVADYGNGSIRRVSPVGTNWVVTTISGPGAFSQPWGAALGSAGNLFVTDYGNATVLMGLVELPLPPEVAFSGAPTNGIAPLAVTFTNLSSHATNYVWNFGDGNTLTIGSNANVTETYTNAGAYTVILTAHGPGGVNALTNTAYIEVTTAATNVPNPTIQFVAPNTVLVSWPDTGNYVLQTNSNLSVPNWVNYGGPVTTSNGISSVTIVLPPGMLFFRLTAGTIQNVPPSPTIGFAGLNTLVISWPGTGNFTLQTNADLATTNWGDYGGPVTTTNGMNSVTNTAIAHGQNRLFFRLKQ